MFLSKSDVSRISVALNMKPDEFTQAYCRWVPAKNGEMHLSLREKSNYDCIFWAVETGSDTDGRCSIYKERPLQCRTFPFWPSMLMSSKSWLSVAEDCPGIDHGDLYAFESITELLALQQSEPILSRKHEGRE